MDYGAVYLTAKKTKIKSLSKQSKFEGSDREVRGWIIKQLVTPLIKGGKGGSNVSSGLPHPPTLPANKGLQPLALTIDDIKSEFPHKDIEKIVQDLVNERIVEIREGIISILE